MIKKIVGLLFAAILVISTANPLSSHASDISNHQMVTELTFWANKNVILPDAKGNYNPNRAVTRGEFASYIARALELPDSSKYIFTDLKQGSRITREIQNAAGAGILSGYPDGTFNASQKITRQQMAGMLNNALRFLGVPLKEAPLTFDDNSRIYHSFTKGVATSVYYNIIRGDHTAKGVYFKPKDNATIAHAAAFLYRMYFVAEDSKKVDEPKKEVVDSSSYYVGKVSNGEVTINPTEYTSFDAALKAYEASDSLNLIFQGNKIIKMSSGLVYAADTAENTTSVYANKNLTNQITYVTEGRELKYKGSNGEYAIVQVGDIVGYAKLAAVELVPTSLIKGRDYYYASDSLLMHKTYNHVKGAFEGEYSVGPKPSFMQSGVNYYSFDGVHFYDANDKLVGTYYPYFQFASVRKPSNYTADELNKIIESELALREATGASQYKDATTKSKLLGLGESLKEVEASQHVNALFILATAIHESNFGMSVKAQTINNLFGIKVFDHDEVNTGEKYNEPKNSILSFLTEYINKNYVPQSGKFPFGAAPGNKTSGINVYYASDPHWGSKIAGHLYRIDSTYGNKDYGLGRIGMVMATAGPVNARVEPSINSAVAFSYAQKRVGESGEFGYPVLIVDEVKAEDGYVWYKIYSDANPPADYAWIRSDLIKVVAEY